MTTILKNTGLLGIVKNNEVWLSDHRFLNDPDEYIYGQNLCLEILKEITDSESCLKFKKFLNEVVDKLSKKKCSSIFIASMSLSVDCLDQWRGYGKEPTSVCIVFNGDYKLWQNENSGLQHIQQQKIIYEESEQRAVIERFIKIFKDSFYGKEKIENFTFPFIGKLAYLVEDQFLLFKNKPYKSEKEVRITIANLRLDLFLKLIKHRVSNNLIVPYISTKYLTSKDSTPQYKLPIKKIILNPSAHEDQFKSIENFLSNEGYCDVPVVFSEVKYRG